MRLHNSRPRQQHTIVCWFCGERRPVRDIIGFDRKVRICRQCTTGLDALRDGAADAVCILRRECES